MLVALLALSGLCAQSPDEHASHHPAAAGAAAMPAAGGSAAPVGGMPAGAGGMMEQMGEMMKNMGTPPPKELYPTLMALPELTPEKRQQVELQAAERMHSGTMLMGQALDSLNAGTQSGNYAAMHEAMNRGGEVTMIPSLLRLFALMLALTSSLSAALKIGTLNCFFLVDPARPAEGHQSGKGPQPEVPMS